MRGDDSLALAYFGPRRHSSGRKGHFDGPSFLSGVSAAASCRKKRFGYVEARRRRDLALAGSILDFHLLLRWIAYPVAGINGMVGIRDSWRGKVRKKGCWGW